MCTSVMLRAKDGHILLGRTMDFAYALKAAVYAVPAGFRWISDILPDRFDFLAIGQHIGDHTVFVDGVNRAGFAAAALYFSGCAQYARCCVTEKQTIAAYDVLHLLLGQCETVKDIREVLDGVIITGKPDPVTQMVAPLHWIAADRSGACVVVESTAQGLHIYENPLGVLANSPELPWHLTNLRNYFPAVPTQPPAVQWCGVPLNPFGQGAGTMPLPGGYTSPARFVRTAFQKAHIAQPDNLVQAVTAGFHILEGVSIPRGIVVTDHGMDDYTQYTAFLDLTDCAYFFRTYDNSQITVARLPDELEKSNLPVLLGPLEKTPVFSVLGER